MDINLLLSKGAVIKDYSKNEPIFEEGGFANFYYQIIEGCVKVLVSNDNGKEFIQGYFYNGDSFGEPPLLINERYPSTAVALQNSKIIKLSRDNFFQILEEHPSIQKEHLELMARRIHEKTTIQKSIINQSPEFRIIHFLDSHKKNAGTQELIPFTRQEIADFTGLRVETVIRVVSKMNKQKKLDIIDHKIYY